MTMVRFERVSKRYGAGKDALSNINFELARGEFAFLTGHSGAGKSTLLRSEEHTSELQSQLEHRMPSSA